MSDVYVICIHVFVGVQPIYKQSTEGDLELLLSLSLSLEPGWHPARPSRPLLFAAHNAGVTGPAFIQIPMI